MRQARIAVMVSGPAPAAPLPRRVRRRGALRRELRPIPPEPLEPLRIARPSLVVARPGRRHFFASGLAAGGVAYSGAPFTLG